MASGPVRPSGRRSASGPPPELVRALALVDEEDVEVGREVQLLRPQLAEPDHGERQVRPGGLDRVPNDPIRDRGELGPGLVRCELARRVPSHNRNEFGLRVARFGVLIHG